VRGTGGTGAQARAATRCRRPREPPPHSAHAPPPPGLAPLPGWRWPPGSGAAGGGACQADLFLLYDAAVARGGAEVAADADGDALGGGDAAWRELARAAAGGGSGGSSPLPPDVLRALFRSRLAGFFGFVAEVVAEYESQMAREQQRHAQRAARRQQAEGGGRRRKGGKLGEEERPPGAEALGQEASGLQPGSDQQGSLHLDSLQVGSALSGSQPEESEQQGSQQQQPQPRRERKQPAPQPATAPAGQLEASEATSQGTAAATQDSGATAAVARRCVRVKGLPPTRSSPRLAALDADTPSPKSGSGAFAVASM
jgi:hypothetical protein